MNKLTIEIIVASKRRYLTTNSGNRERELMMSQRSKRELFQKIRLRYLKAYKSGKTRIVEEFVTTTSYHSKNAKQLLKNEPGTKGSKKRSINHKRVCRITRVMDLQCQKRPRKRYTTNKCDLTGRMI